MRVAVLSAPCGFRFLLFFCTFLYASFCTDVQILFAQKTQAFANGSLRCFIDDEGSFFTNAMQSRTLRKADSIFVQKKFDSLNRLIQKNVWNTAQTGPLSVTDYSYEGESPFPESAVTTDNEKKRIIHEYFTAAGLPVKREIYTLSAESRSVEDASKKTVGSKSDKMLFCTETFRYDADKRLIEETVEYAAGSVQGKKRSEKKEYRYAKGGSRPDEFYYKDADKIKQKVYASAADWEETVFFPGGIRILTRYKDEIPVSETVYENNVKKRERAL